MRYLLPVFVLSIGTRVLGTPIYDASLKAPVPDRVRGMPNANSVLAAVTSKSSLLELALLNTNEEKRLREYVQSLHFTEPISKFQTVHSLPTTAKKISNCLPEYQQTLTIFRFAMHGTNLPQLQHHLDILRQLSL